MSKNLLLSKNFSRDASFHKLDTKLNNIIVGNNQPYGSTTIEQVNAGVLYANVQSAIDDLYVFSVLPVNSIIINNDGINPGGAPQVDQYKFEGEVSSEGKETGDAVIINTFGFYTEVLVGDTSEEVVTKVKATLQKAVIDGIAINEVNDGPTDDIIQVSYIDYQQHNLKSFTDKGITVTPTIMTPPRNGYGTWNRIGTESKTLDGALEPVTLYYFRRDN